VLRRALTASSQGFLETAPLVERAVELGRRLAGPQSAAWRRLVVSEAFERSEADIIMEAERRASWRRQFALVRQAQSRGELDPSVDAEMLWFAVFCISLLPQILPQVTRLALGLSPTDEEFQLRQRVILEGIMKSLGPSG
jgi:hypothetical protein